MAPAVHPASASVLIRGVSCARATMQCSETRSQASIRKVSSRAHCSSTAITPVSVTCRQSLVTVRVSHQSSVTCSSTAIIPLSVRAWQKETSSISSSGQCSASAATPASDTLIQRHCSHSHTRYAYRSSLFLSDTMLPNCGHKATRCPIAGIAAYVQHDAGESPCCTTAGRCSASVGNTRLYR